MPNRHDNELWQQEAKKLGGESLVEVIEEIRNSQRTMLENFEAIDKRVTANANDIGQLLKAFPSNDIDGHRRYHQLIIDNTAAKRELATAIKEKTISGLLWSAVLWLATEAWTHLPKLFGGGQ